jgi:pimeloyl-ACP methyl ester carboxylesterase
LRPRVEGQGIENADLSLRVRGSNRLSAAPVATLGYSSTKDRRIVLIHGYNVSELASLKTMIQLRHVLSERCPIIAPQILTLTWPGNAHWYMGGPASYFAKVDVARRAGQLLYDYSMAEYQRGKGPRELVIVAHSLGCRLTLEFLSQLRQRPSRLKKLVVILMAAAVPVEQSALIAQATANADEVTVLHSKDDRVLRRWFRLGQTVAREGRWPEAIGSHGKPGVPPWTTARFMVGYDHSDYWGGDATADAVAERLQTNFPALRFRIGLDRSHELPTRATLDETALLAAYSLQAL